ncbi:MAG: hypothetical protein KQJ78_13005 [Deltaproteobacteria bacterium]|nr:hypothetical protein [Deltaproteobacteria bacterium]
MHEPLVMYAIYVSLGLAALAALLARGARPWAWAAGTGAALAGWLALAVGSWHLGRPPLAGLGETLPAMAGCLALLGLSVLRRREEALLAQLLWGSVAGLLLLDLILPFPPPLDWFLFDSPWVQAFFLCRPGAVVLFWAAALAAIAAGLARGGPAAGGMFGHARRWLVAGSAVFLCGEFAGFYWCYLWLGDYWRWGRNFLASLALFLLATLALHLPPRWAAHPVTRAACQALPGVASLAFNLWFQWGEA